MATIKKYFDENFGKSLDYYFTNSNKICIRFFNQKDNFENDFRLDLETIEEFILDLTFELQKIKNEGGKNG